MEFAVAILSAAVSAAMSSAVPKLGRVVGKAKTDATFIQDELRLIKDLIRRNTFVVRYISEWIAQLRRLAYEIEDCIDKFEVKKTSPERFAEEIADLKERSKDTRERLLAYIKIHRGLQELAAQGQGQQAAPAAAAFELLVPHELQELLLLGRQSEDWLDNLNCLLYFCMFPHDHHARRNPLIRRWLAEGLVRGEADAVKHLKAFIDGNIINTTAKSNNGMMKRCQPPDEILRFIYQQSSATNFILFCDDMANLQAECARRLSLHPSDDIPDDMNLPDFSHLHTLAVFHANANPDIYGAMLKFGNYEVLRVLDLKECAPLSEGHLLAICKLLLLKYLSFQGGTDRLPRDIGKLAWLETLDMRGSNTVTVYKKVLKMRRLKHLLGKFQLCVTEVSGAVWGCKTTKLAKFLQQKSVLQTLSGFVVNDWRGFPQLMILMRKLRKVKIWCKSNASEANLHAISSAIIKFICDGIQEPGRSLSINFQECSGQFLNDVQVQGSLTSLKLQGKLSEFPQFVARLSGVEELCLSSTSLTWNVIQAGLSNLRILKYLKLVEDNLGCVEILPKHLRSLERLCLVCASNLDITIQVGALPDLVSLHLICQSLKVLPGNPGIEFVHMTKLQEVGLHSEVDEKIKNVWEIGVGAHPNKPNVGTAILC